MEVETSYYQQLLEQYLKKAVDDNLDGYSEVEVKTSGVNIWDYFICHKDIWFFHVGNHFILIVAHIAGEISVVELHSFYDIDFCLHRLGLFYCNNPIFSNLFHRIGNHLSDFFITC